MVNTTRNIKMGIQAPDYPYKIISSDTVRSYAKPMSQSFSLKLSNVLSVSNT